MAKLSRNPILDGTKKCNICGIVKPVTEYSPYRNNFRGGCKSCNYKKNKEIRGRKTKEERSVYWKRFWAKKENRIKKYQATKTRIKKIKIQAVEYLGGKCSRCGYSNCIEALEFHHKDPREKQRIRSMAAIDRRICFESNKKELDKCILLCANCHREIHFNE